MGGFVEGIRRNDRRVSLSARSALCVGLVLFGEKSKSLVPLSQDHTASSFAKTLAADRGPSFGSNNPMLRAKAAASSLRSKPAPLNA